MRFAGLSLLLVVAATAIPASAAVPAGPVNAGLAKAYALKRDAYRRGDVEQIRQVYATDAIVVGESVPATEGIENIMKVYRAGLPTRRDLEVKVVRREISPKGDIVYDFVNLSLLPRDLAQPATKLTEVLLWRWSGDRWRIASEFVMYKDVDLSAIGRPLE